MNEKQDKKQNLSTILLIIAILIIIIMGIFIYKIYTDKENLTSQITDVNNQLSNLQEKVEQTNTIDNNTSNTENTTVSSDKSTEITSLSLGKYLLNEVDTSNPELPSNEGCGVTLKENNVCEIYEGYGNTRIGIYTIENNKLVCNTIIRRGEEGPLSYTENDIIFEFNIINQDKLELSRIENNAKTAVSKDSALDKSGSNIYNSYGLTIGMTYSKSNL